MKGGSKKFNLMKRHDRGEQVQWARRRRKNKGRRAAAERGEGL
jgi:hypothetical protein